MKTLGPNAMIKQNRMRDYEFILEDLELAFPKEQLETITEQWNNGAEVEDIAKFQKRPPEEIFLALFHQARKNKVKRPAYKKSTLMVPGREQLRRMKK